MTAGNAIELIRPGWAMIIIITIVIITTTIIIIIIIIYQLFILS